MCPLGERVETVRSLEQSGAAAVVLPSLFVEQIEHEDLQVHWLREYNSEQLAEASTYFRI